MGDSDKLMDVESGQKEACEEELPSDDEEGGKVNLKSNYSSSFILFCCGHDIWL